MSASATDNPPEFKHAADMEWEIGRFGNVTKFLFHPRLERPTEPNAGFLKYAPGASFPLHRHDFAQIWYIRLRHKMQKPSNGAAFERVNDRLFLAEITAYV